MKQKKEFSARQKAKALLSRREAKKLQGPADTINNIQWDDLDGGGDSAGDMTGVTVFARGGVVRNYKPAVEFDKKYGTKISQKWPISKLAPGLTHNNLYRISEACYNNPVAKQKLIYLCKKLDETIFPYPGVTKLARVEKENILRGMASQFNYDDIVEYSIKHNSGSTEQSKRVHAELYKMKLETEWIMSPQTLEKVKSQIKALSEKAKPMNPTTYKRGGEINADDPKVKNAVLSTAGQTGGLLVGNRHTEGGIKAVNKSSGQPIEMEGGEVVITRNAVTDNNKREFNGEMMTNREILSAINESGGGVAFADGGEVHNCACKGNRFNYGGRVRSDYEIVTEIRRDYPGEFRKGAKEEIKEHRGTFNRIRKGELTNQQAAERVAAEHLAKKPHYYKMYANGGMLTVANKLMPSLNEFQRVGEPVRSPYAGETDLYYPMHDKYSDRTMYFKGGHRRATKIPAILAYKTYLYDIFEVVFSDLPAQVRNGLTLGKQNIIDQYLNE